tara:strand:+ start:209 stop:490 length:282 start_codon:yes stop_codon:yes gene_type:complete
MSTEKYVAGTVATVFTISMKIPQIYHTLKTKRTKDISMMFLLIGVLNHITWVVYAYFDNINLPLIICDGVCISLSFVLLGLKLYYDNKENNEP